MSSTVSGPSRPFSAVSHRIKHPLDDLVLDGTCNAQAEVHFLRKPDVPPLAGDDPPKPGRIQALVCAQ